MLRGIHKASSNWLGKIVMAVVIGLLVVSFAIWGIGDIFRGFGQSTVAKIGRTEITVEQFRQIYNDRLQQLGRAARPPDHAGSGAPSASTGRSLGQLVAEAALDERARQLRLDVSDAEVARQIMNDPNFQGSTASSTAPVSSSCIRSAGYTEQRFVAEQQRITMRRADRRHCAGRTHRAADHGGCDASTAIENEQRAIEYVVLGPRAGRRGRRADARGDSRSISTSARARSARRNTARSRSCRCTPADLAQADSVTDADAKAVLRADAARFGTPERRQVAADRHSRTPKKRRRRRRAREGGTDLRRARQGARPHGEATSISASSPSRA